MPSLSLRRASESDADAIPTLTRAAYAEWAALIGREPKPMTADYGRAVREHRIDLHEIDGHLIAFIELALHSDHLLIENIAFYTRRGFTEYRRAPIAAGGEIVHMRKPIAP